MEGAKPIEAGCRAWIIQNGSVTLEDGWMGSPVKVIGLSPIDNEDESPNIKRYRPWWLIEGIDRQLPANSQSIEFGWSMPEQYLLRIDDDDLQKQIESEKEKEIA